MLQLLILRAQICVLAGAGEELLARFLVHALDRLRLFSQGLLELLLRQEPGLAVLLLRALHRSADQRLHELVLPDEFLVLPLLFLVLDLVGEG